MNSIGARPFDTMKFKCIADVIFELPLLINQTQFCSSISFDQNDGLPHIIFNLLTKGKDCRGQSCM